ncbi:hypothetical protein Rmf_03750 [Roseomonas fluvialis]|uniref:Uncharacterized protein n=1 Tax=Roseomonas fluvialis TaxID=1750527 RepID=A0ABM7XY78_9PROT|nr:hypothetical protein Rmf_03750 [Roseomonas fluvialis]
MAVAHAGDVDFLRCFGNPFRNAGSYDGIAARDMARLAVEAAALEPPRDHSLRLATIAKAVPA